MTCLLALIAWRESSPRARAEAEERFRGEAADDSFGYAVARAGDWQNDGFEDLAVGAIFNDDAGSAAGKVYVFPGTRGFAPAPILTMTGEAPDDHFGVSVDAAGDVNGDGFADLIVGVRFSDRTASAAGAAFIFYGGPSADSVPDRILVGEAKDDWFGQSVAGAGDVNGDGFDDIVVGAPFNDERGSAAGKAYVHFGGSGPAWDPPLALFGDSQDDGQFGWSVGGAGDVNGDGFDDVIVGARLYGTGLDRARGRAYLFLGGLVPDGTVDVVLTGEVRDDWFGHAVAGAGDVNGDGFDDMLVGAPFFDLFTGTTLLSAVGRIYVILGGTAPDVLPDMILTGQQGDEQLGWSLDGGRDLDGDGLADVAGGARFFDAGPLMAAGRVFIGYGAPAPPLRLGPRIAGLGADGQFGHDVALTGHVSVAPGAIGVGAVYGSTAGGVTGSAARLFPHCVRLLLEADAVALSSCKDFDAARLYRGLSSLLAAGDAGECLTRQQPPSASFTDPAIPPMGDGFVYLATGEGGALEGNAGFGSDGAERPLPAPCP